MTDKTKNHPLRRFVAVVTIFDGDKAVDDIMFDGNIEAQNIQEAITFAEVRAKHVGKNLYPEVKDLQVTMKSCEPADKTQTTGKEMVLRNNVVDMVGRIMGKGKSKKDKPRVKVKNPPPAKVIKVFSCPIEKLCKRSYIIQDPMKPESNEG